MTILYKEQLKMTNKLTRNSFINDQNHGQQHVTLSTPCFGIKVFPATNKWPSSGQKISLLTLMSHLLDFVTNRNKSQKIMF